MSSDFINAVNDEDPIEAKEFFRKMMAMKLIDVLNDRKISLGNEISKNFDNEPSETENI